MSLQQDIEKALSDFGISMSEDLKDSAIKALKDAGSKNVQEIALDFNQVIKLSNDGLTLQIVSEKYWEAIDKGRKAGKKAPPSRVFGKKWQNLHGIDPRKVILEIQIAYNKKKGLKYTPKILSFDKASKQLSFITARKIGRDGIKPKPFRDRVINDGRLTALEKTISELLGKNIKANVI